MVNITRAIRMDKKERKKQLLDAAVKAAEKFGFAAVTCRNVADIAGCSGPLVTNHLGPVKRMRDAIVVEGIKTGNMTIIAQGLVAKHARCLKLDADIRKKALASLTQ